MSNVKQGDMAKVVAPHANAGLVVEVLLPASESDMNMLVGHGYSPHIIVWICKIFGGGVALDPYENKRRYVYPGYESLIWDRHLRRIKPGEPDETIEELTELEVTA